ncbi:MAG: monovalent cation/H+ antiporter subunit D family protein [Mogibacterium sp.]|nr:monovalent cation/H+ antiporter subunit D family protein [Mogibacterium sp.]
MLVGKEIRAEAFTISNGISITFDIDPAGVVFACASSVLWLIIIAYSIGYLKDVSMKNKAIFYIASAVCQAAVTGLCFAADLVSLFLFFELMIVAAYPFTALGNVHCSRNSQLRYILYMLISGLISYIALVILYPAAGAMDFTPGGCLTEDVFRSISAKLAFLMLVFGGSTAAGIIPLHSWLTASRNSYAPSCAILQTVSVSSAGAFCIFRVVLYVFGPDLARSCGGMDILAWMAIITIIISSLIAVTKTDLMSKITYNTLGQQAIIILGVCTATPFGTAGALYHIAAHGAAKIILIMAAGAVLLDIKRTQIKDLEGIGRRKPITMGAFAAASAGLAGLPLFAGFVSQSNIIYGAVNAGRPAYIAAIIFGSVLTMVNLMPVVLSAFRKVDDTGSAEAGKTGVFMLAAIMAACLIVIILGILPDAGLHLFDASLMAGNSIFDPLM